MSYKVMDDGLCVDKGIESIGDAQKIGSEYARETDTGTITIEDESTGETVSTGHATFTMRWSRLD